jgi:hypothetical protein
VSSFDASTLKIPFNATCVSALEAGAILKRFVPAFQMTKYHERVLFQRLADLISKRLSSV